MKYFQIRSKLELWLYLTICISCIRWTNSIKFKPSPCPGKFNYESTTNDDRWYGDITFPVNATIEGSTIRIELDRPSQLLVTTAGPITSKENQVYFITHDDAVLEKGSTYKLIFMVKFDKDNVVPMLETIHFNGQRICPPDLVTLALGGGNDYSTPRPDIKATAPTDVLSDIDKKPKNPTRATTQSPYSNNNGGNIDYYTESSNVNRLTTSRVPNSNNYGGDTGNQVNNGYNPGNSNNFGGGNNGNQGNNGYPGNSNYGGGNNGNQGGNGYNPGNLDNFGNGNNGNQGNNGYNPGNSNTFNGNNNGGNQGGNSGQGNNGYNPNTSNNFGSNGNSFNSNNQGNNGYGTGNSGGSSGNNGFNSGNQDTNGGGSSDFGPNSNSNQNGFNSGNANTFGTNGNVNQGNNGFNNFGGNGNSNQGNSGVSGGTQGNRNPSQGGDVIFNNGGGSNNGFTQRPSIGNEATVSGQVACGSVSIANPLITLAQNSEHGQWPWHVALFMRDEVNPSKSSYICGGSLVSKNRVITAAHCVSLTGNRIVNPNSLTAYMGKYNINTDESTSQKRTISSYKVNPEYNKANFHNDIAILSLNDDVEYTNYVRPVCLWEAAEGISDVVGQNGYVVGWGYNEYEQLNTELKQATMPIVSTEKCARSDPQFFSEYVSENAFCAGSLNGTGPCKGDSGGGLVVKRNNSWYLRGIVSVSAAPKKGSVCNNHQYIVFTDTARYNDFIRRNI